MVFSSLVFLYIFLTATILIYYLLPRRARNAFLLAANLVFYFCGEPVYIVLMVFSILKKAQILKPLLQHVPGLFLILLCSLSLNRNSVIY